MNVEIANKLVIMRKRSGLSQEALAEKIGVSRQAVSKWERAESSPDTDNLIALSKLYNVSLDDMLSSNDERNEKVYEGEVRDESEGESKASLIKMIPYPIIVTMIYLFIGIVWDLWHPGWLLFLTIPIWGAVVAYISKRGRKRD
ncbi:MAG: helix-turn-helix transcriptional regulator [Clostridia bacterium]|jgi:transcriptional regulator with XRE-family HTH domain|nr:helix-turn-helix transcriptional regulator [Clostridia bacterium]